MNTNQQIANTNQQIANTQQQVADKIEEKSIMDIISTMVSAKFNNMNPLINNILNHVNYESSIAREVPNVQSKIDIITSQENDQQPSMNNLIATSQSGLQPVTPPQQVVQQPINYITCAKIGIITLAIAGIICWILYVYIPKPYNYISMCVVFAAGLASDFFILKKFCNCSMNFIKS